MDQASERPPRGNLTKRCLWDQGIPPSHQGLPKERRHPAASRARLPRFERSSPFGTNCRTTKEELSEALPGARELIACRGNLRSERSSE